MLGALTPLGHVEPKDWDRTVAVNLTANWRLIRSLDPLLRASDAGRAVFVTSGLGWFARPYTGPYAAAKAALNMLVQVYAAESAQTKVKVNAFNPGLITQSAEVIRDFINDYHEKTEETHVFPRFRKAGQMTDLVDVLLRQHDAGRRLTQTIIRLAPAARNNGDRRRELVSSMQSFIAMYRPHAAREDTELFPKLQKLVSPHEYAAMAEEF